VDLAQVMSYAGVFVDVYIQGLQAWKTSYLPDGAEANQLWRSDVSVLLVNAHFSICNNIPLP
jgi:hypothetical protein